MQYLAITSATKYQMNFIKQNYAIFVAEIHAINFANSISNTETRPHQ